MPYRRYKSDRISKRQPAQRELAVIMSGAFMGTLVDHKYRSYSFHYDRSYEGPDLSVSARKEDGLDHYDSFVTPFFAGLLPDNKQTRKAMARKHNLRGDDMLSLLAEYGKDCPGAIQLCAFDELDDVLAAKGRYVAISKSEIAKRLIESENKSNPEWHGAHESWSLGGNQGKIALARIDDRWMSCEGANPSTHIIKPGVSGMTRQALVEFISMKLAEKVNLSVAKAEYESFDGVDAIVVKRYDRVRSDDGKILRVHQEDFCQILGYLPEHKYDIDTHQVIDVLKSSADKASRGRFVNALFFNYLIGGIDAHGKNFSLLHTTQGATLAPLYDLASVLPYEKVDNDKWRKLPMSIGGQTKIGALTGSDIERFARLYEFDAIACKSNMVKMAEGISPALEELRDEYAHIRNIDEVFEQFIPTITANCKAMITNIDRDHKTLVRPGLSLLYGGKLPRTESQVPLETLEF